MVQLEVSNIFLDLYDLDPPKLTFSIEDIRDTSTRSVFSRTFRVPATAHNNQFFNNVFEVNGIDFDVTQKREARIYVDGILFREGQIRLNKIFDTREGAKIDYELIFLGETKDFATSVGEGFLTDLNLSAYTHTLNYQNVTKSWNAYPQSGLTEGLFEGNILYPLIDFGVRYDEDGVPTQTRISQNNTGSHFTQNSHPLPANRFKPMIRAKALWDTIFEEAGYTYESEFFKTREFITLYVSAFGNTDTAITPTTANLFTGFYTNDFADTPIPFNVIDDPGNNWSASTSSYVAPVTGTYTIYYSVKVTLTVPQFASATITTTLRKNGSTTLSTDSDIVSGGQTTTITLQGYIVTTLTAGDTIDLTFTQAGSIDNIVLLPETTLQVLTAPGDVDVASLLDKDYKKIDFIKDIITKFRLVLVPDPNISKKFIVEPWQDYIGRGNVIDWTDKLDLSKDVVLEPLFFSQQNIINFKDTPDEDFLNKINQDVFKEVFGTLIVDSNNDYLSGSRDITTGFAPTPITQIERKNTSIGDRFIIPQIHAHEIGTDASYNPQHLPIKPKTRLLYYNGLQSTDGINWYLQSDPSSPYSVYPFVSFYSTAPNASSTLNLNWQIEQGYIIGDDVALLGDSVYDRFWSGYINTLYNPFSRRLTGYFVLDSTDLLNFSFDDVIFLKNGYYYVEKIYDVSVGKKSSVKVDLIKLIDYSVNTGGFVPPRRLWNTTEVNWEDADFTWN